MPYMVQANASRRRRTSRRSRSSRRRRAARRRGTPRKCRIIRGRRYRPTNTPVILKPTTTTAKTTHLFPASFINQWMMKGGSMESLARACFRGGALPVRALDRRVVRSLSFSIRGRGLSETKYKTETTLFPPCCFFALPSLCPREKNPAEQGRQLSLQTRRLTCLSRTTEPTRSGRN